MNSEVFDKLIQALKDDKSIEYFDNDVRINKNGIIEIHIDLINDNIMGVISGNNVNIMTYNREIVDDHLSDCRYIDTFDNIKINKYNNITSCTIIGKNYEFIQDLHHITKMNLCSCEYLLEIFKCHNLTELEIYNCTSLKYISHLTKLNTLVVKNCYNICELPYNLTKIISDNKTIKTLDISYLYNLTDIIIESAITIPENVQNVVDYYAKNDRTLRVILKK